MPPSALLVSLGAFAVPLLATWAFPTWTARDGALLVWLPALVPAFLLSYQRGWTGASLSLGGGLAVLALTQLEVTALAVRAPDWSLVFVVAALFLVVSVGSGAVAERLRGQREAAERSSFVDVLTGLPNRRQAFVFIEAAWAAAHGGSLAVVLFDVDHLEAINRGQGRPEGDRVLQAFAGLLGTRTRRADLSARVGGEEFMTVMTAASIETAEAFAGEVLGGMAEVDLGWGSVSVSSGVAGIEKGMGSPDILIAAADRALHAAKAGGGGRVFRADRTRRPAALAAQPEIPPAEAPRSIEGLRILVVDDDPAPLRATTRLLERMGALVTSATGPRAALEVLKSDAPVDLLVTDIVMPEMSGFTLVDLMSEVRPGLRVLYISGYPQEEVYWGGTPGARSAFLAKPMELGELRAAIEGLLEIQSATPTRVEAPGPSGGAEEPAAPSGKEEPSQERAAPAPRLPGHLVIVDDDEDIVSSLQRLFQRAGYERPMGLTDPRGLSAILESREIDLVVLDLHMPDMDGFEVLASIRQAVGPEGYLPVLILTGDDDPELRRKALAAGAMDFLAKPFDPAEAEARVGNLLATRFLTQRVARDRDDLEDRVKERTAQLADTRTEILHRLALAAEYRDDVTGRHAERVGLLGSLIASELGMSAMEVDLIRRTGPLHDIGKIGVPDSVLRKPTMLTPPEFELMKRHTLIGGEILGGSGHRILQVAQHIAESHHERWDGSGYPRELAGDTIPVEARIVTVADTFDTLTHNRPYRAAVDPEAAVAEVVRCRKTQFDPEVVDAFQSICARVGPAELPALSDPIDPFRDTIPPTAWSPGAN